MSDLHYSLSSNNSNVKDATTSIDDLPIRITGFASSYVKLIKMVEISNSNHSNQHKKTPKKEDSGSSSAKSRPKSRPKSRKVMKFGNKYRQLHLDLSDFGDLDITESSSSTSSTCKSTAQPLCRKHWKEASNSSMNRIDKKPRCKTNFFKAMKSFEKNNSICNRRTKSQYSKYVFHKVNKSPKTPINPKVNQTTGSTVNQKYIKDSSLKNVRSVKKNGKTTIDADLKTNKTVDESTTTTWVREISFSDNGKSDFTELEEHSAGPRNRLGSLDLDSNRDICSSAALSLIDRVLNAQDKFKLKVRIAKTKMEYLSRNCRFLHLNEPEMNKPLLILDFDSLLIPFELPSEDLSKHKLEISRLVHTMDSHFNIAVWSATTMKTLVSRLKYLNIFEENKVTKVIFCLDRTSTITAFVPAVGNTIVKSPEVIWNLYPQFNKNNTIMINEDLKKFVFKQHGIVIGTHDDEKLIKYCELGTISNFLANLITSTRSFSSLNIQSWKKPWN